MKPTFCARCDSFLIFSFVLYDCNTDTERSAATSGARVSRAQQAMLSARLSHLRDVAAVAEAQGGGREDEAGGGELRPEGEVDGHDLVGHLHLHRHRHHLAPVLLHTHHTYPHKQARRMRYA